MVLTDQEIIESQKGILKLILYDLLKNWSFTNGFVNFSLPSKVFSNYTQMHIIPQLFCNVQYLYDAHNSTKTQKKNLAPKLIHYIKRIEFLLVYFMKGMYQGTQTKKPYNPYIGETLQAYFGDGTEIFIEHTNHNPPIDSFYIINKKLNIKIHGSFSLVGKTYHSHILKHYY